MYALSIHISGRVQGVGFRPYLVCLAKQYQVNGTVQNNLDGVRLWIEGEEKHVRQMVEEIKKRPPRLAKVERISVHPVVSEGFSAFTILPSDPKGTATVVVPIDTGFCEECRQELQDPRNFRFEYPFITCSQCGPRYTIIEELPYDRKSTSMASFPMCEKCQKEYDDPTNRRYHTQPIACPTCGPRLRLLDIASQLSLKIG